MKKIGISIICLCLILTGCRGGYKEFPLQGSVNSKTQNLVEELKHDKEIDFAYTVIDAQDYDEAAVHLALTEFALRLFEVDIMEDGAQKNILISPTSMITALGMTSYGAKGDTLAQMEALFGVSRGHLNHHNYQLLSNLSDKVKIANSIWLTNDESLTVNEDFLYFDEEFYGAEIYETAFNDATKLAINDWVERNTDGMIKDVLSEIPPDAVMYLINALAFEAEWAEKYDSTQIRENMKFTNSVGEEQKVDMMASVESLYLEDDYAKGFIKYYKDKEYAFVALLPNEDVNLYQYAKGLTGKHLQNMLSNPQQATVQVHIPEFSYEYSVEMSDMLEKMGMTDAFDGGKADFTNMATSTEGNIFINRVIHKTFIEVSPHGTKAGAATLVEMNCESAPYYEDLKEVFLERPFIYMIIDTESNQPLFIGVLNQV